MRGGVRAALRLAAACAALAACAPGDGGGADASEAASGLESAPSLAEAADAGSGIPRLAGEGELSDYRLTVVNGTDADLRVYASAEAEPVLLGAVAAGDSLRVDLRVRADEVRLEARDADDATRAEASLRLTAEHTNRWVITP